MRKYGVLRIGIPLILMLALLLALAASGYASSADAVWPVSSGEMVESNGKLVLDRSHAEDGYVMARVSEPGSNRMKMRVAFGKSQLTYDLNSNGDYEVFPLQLGSGNYEISLFENVKGSKYSAQGKITISVQLKDENAAFLCPNQYVNYLDTSVTVAKSDELSGDAAAADIYDKVCDFMTGEFAYDFIRAKTINAGALPEVDPCFEKRMGICQDLSAVMCCMLRVQGIPAKLVIGYADKYYHAWTMAVIDGEEKFFDPTAAIGAMKASRYTVERMY